MQFSISEPGLKKLKANWHVRFDEELDIFTGLSKENRITSTPFDNEEISFVLSLWNKPVRPAEEIKLMSEEQQLPEPTRELHFKEASSPSVYVDSWPTSPDPIEHGQDFRELLHACESSGSYGLAMEQAKFHSFEKSKFIGGEQQLHKPIRQPRQKATFPFADKSDPGKRGQPANLIIEAKFTCEREVLFVSTTTLELPNGSKLVGKTRRGTISDGSTCTSSFSVPGLVMPRYFNIDFLLGYYTNEAERFVSRKALKKYNAAPHAASWLKKALEKERFFDCVIKVEGQEIKVHRVVLGTQSEVFDAIFMTKGTEEYRTGVIVINDASYAAVKAMIEYLYDGSLENVHNYVGEVFKLADKYQIEDLKYRCTEILGTKVDEKNFCQIWASVYLYTADGIKAMCKDFIRKHRNFLMSTEWKEFTAKNKDAAIKLYEYLPQS